jgi:polyferredoxin
MRKSIPKGPTHKELHSHVNPHVHHKEVHPSEYKPKTKDITSPGVKKPEPLHSRFRLDWIFTKIKIKNFYPFPLVTILLLMVTLFPLILLALGSRLPFTIVNLPWLSALFDAMGIYNHRDLFLIGTWVIWWPLFIFTILIFKRIWCGGFCPFGLMTDIGNFFGTKLRKGKTAKPINITKYIFIGFLIFKALGYLHDAINITNSVVLTIEFVVFFLVFSFVIGLIAPRRTFCRLFCFLGSLPHLFGRLSLYTLETDRSKCVNCEGQWCLTGNKSPPYGIAQAKEPLINIDGCPMYINIPQLSHKESNRNCILCGNCIKNCPYDAIHYKPKVPGYELYKGIDLNFHETIFVLGLIPLLAMFVAMEGGLLTSFATFLQFPITAHWAITGAFFLLATLLFVFVYYLITGLGSVVLGVNYKLALRNFGYIFLPFAYLAMMRDIIITYFLKGSFLPVTFPGLVTAYPFIDIPLILIGSVWSVYMAVKISQVTMKQEDKEVDNNLVSINTLLHSVVIIFLTTFWMSQLLPEYLVTLASQNIHYTAPFLFSAVLIGGFILVMCNIKRFKSKDKFVLAMDKLGRVKK